MISFGRPRAVATSGQGAIPVEIAQWGGAHDVTPDLLRFAETYLAACTASTGYPPTGPVRLMVTEPGFGGTRTDGAIAIGCPAGFDADRDAGTLHFLAHELFHDWLGGRLKPATEGETLCWFWEGFTEYLSLWQLEQAHLVSQAWFGERLELHETLASRAEGRDEHAYADASVTWRDSAIEPLAYQGSALLALSLDVALRKNGGPGLMTMIHDLGQLPGGRYALADLRGWLEGHGLSDFWRERFEKPAPHTLHEDLLAIGVVERDAVEPLTYLGVQLDAPGPFGLVVAIDPDGPAADIVRLGDRVQGLTRRARRRRSRGDPRGGCAGPASRSALARNPAPGRSSGCTRARSRAPTSHGSSRTRRSSPRSSVSTEPEQSLNDFQRRCGRTKRRRRNRREIALAPYYPGVRM